MRTVIYIVVQLQLHSKMVRHVCVLSYILLYNVSIDGMQYLSVLLGLTVS